MRLLGFPAIQWVRFQTLEQIYAVVSTGWYSGKPIISNMIPYGDLLRLTFFGTLQIDGHWYGYAMCNQEKEVLRIFNHVAPS